MTRNIENKVVSIIQGVLGDILDAETYDVHRSEINGWDSLIHIEIVFACEDEFEVELSADELASIQTINDLIRILSDKLN
jgi:acyl carrier protein